MTQFTIEDYMATARFDGLDLTAGDCARLEGQMKRVYDLMKDGNFRTLLEIEKLTGDPQASISARLRDYRRLRWGAHIVEKRRKTTNSGTWEYRLIVRTGNA